jgi:hypothetical protein
VHPFGLCYLHARIYYTHYTIEYTAVMMMYGDIYLILAPSICGFEGGGGGFGPGFGAQYVWAQSICISMLELGGTSGARANQQIE